MLEVRPREIGISEREHEAAFRGRLDGLNPLVMNAIGKIVEGDSAAMVVVLSGHGGRHGEHEGEWRRSLLAVMAPMWWGASHPCVI
jgi:hypothetical protein